MAYAGHSDFRFLLVAFVAIVAAAIWTFIKRGLPLQSLGLGTADSRELQTRMETFAHDLGLEFSATDPLDINRRYYGFGKLFGGGVRKVFNVAYGTLADCAIKAFDCHVLLSPDSFGPSDRSESDTENDPSPWSLMLNPRQAKAEQLVVPMSAVILDTDVIFKPLFIRPEGISEKLTNSVHHCDLTFESDEFNRAFYVECPDRKFAFNLLTPRVMQLLLDRPRWHIDLFGKSMVFYTGSTMGPYEMKEAITFGQELLRLVPDYLRAPSQNSG